VNPTTRPFRALRLRAMLAMLAACGVGVIGCGGEPPTPEGPLVVALSIGERLDAIEVAGPDGRPARRDLSSPYAKATVLWFSSCTCDCVADCAQRIEALLARYAGKDVRFVAIDANPFDTVEEIAALRARLGASYPIERDVDGRTMRRVGIRASASVAIVDGEGRLRFRGAIDDDRFSPTTSYVERAVDAILAGRNFEPHEAKTYGCVYPKPPR